MIKYKEPENKPSAAVGTASILTEQNLGPQPARDPPPFTSIERTLASHDRFLRPAVSRRAGRGRRLAQERYRRGGPDSRQAHGLAGRTRHPGRCARIPRRGFAGARSPEPTGTEPL